MIYFAVRNYYNYWLVELGELQLFIGHLNFPKLYKNIFISISGPDGTIVLDTTVILNRVSERLKIRN